MLGSYPLRPRKIDKAKDGEDLAILRQSCYQPYRGQGCVRLEAELGVIKKYRLDEQRPLLVPCAGHEVVAKVFSFYASTTVALKDITVPTETLATVTGKPATRLDK